MRNYTQSLHPASVAGMASGVVDNAVGAVQSPQQPAQDQIVQAGTTAAHTLFAFVTVFVLAFYWLVERAQIKRVCLRLVPVRLARDVNTVWMEVEDKLGGWVRGQIILMLIVGTMATLGYAVLGLPNPALLGVVAGLCEVIPMVGPFLAFAPAVLVALAVLDPTHALLVVAYALVIQQIESNVLVPRVMGHTVGVSAADGHARHPGRRRTGRPARCIPGGANRGRRAGHPGARAAHRGPVPGRGAPRPDRPSAAHERANFARARPRIFYT